jgi:hypothetical protein
MQLRVSDYVDGIWTTEQKSILILYEGKKRRVTGMNAFLALENHSIGNKYEDDYT